MAARRSPIHELASVTGGFLPLLGLLGMGANLAGSIMGGNLAGSIMGGNLAGSIMGGNLAGSIVGGIGKSKAQEAQQITAAAGAGQPTGQAPAAGQGAGPAPAATGDLLAPHAPASGDRCCGVS